MSSDPRDKYAVSPATPDREIDAKIAEKVFGYWDVGMYEGKLVHGENSMNGWPMLTPHFSTSISAAWEIVDAMRNIGHGYSVVVATNAAADKQNGVKFYQCWRGLGHSIFDADAHEAPYAIADTVPLAICLAALLTSETPDFRESLGAKYENLASHNLRESPSVKTLGVSHLTSKGEPE